MNWMILLHGLLFAGYYNIFSDDKIVASIIPIIGIFVSIIMCYSFWSAERAIGFILTKWNKYIENNNYKYDDFPPVWAGAFSTCPEFAKKKANRIISTYFSFLDAHKSLPILFTTVWIVNLIFCIVTNG